MSVLFTFGYQRETRGAPFSCLAFRWTARLDRWFLGFIEQHQSEDGTWHDSHARVFGVSVTRHWALGADHVYYDGPHCSFSVGPVHLLRGGHWHTGECIKCLPATPARHHRAQSDEPPGR